ncbi:hypothetical protein AB0I93_00130 [Streptomyces sp. NPDC049967]|uniref:hypothetical protein n=1 Tax=Streptomyces sp. NPDC049967 TaxID=3155658 RepID=UPI0034360C5E
MVAQPNTALLSDADAADPLTRFVRTSALGSAGRPTAVVEQHRAEHHARNMVQAVIKAAAAAPGRLTPRGAAAKVAKDIQQSAAEAAAEAAGMRASEGELSAFIRAAYTYRDNLAAEAMVAGQDPAQARHIAEVTMRAIVRAMAGEAS